MKIDVLKLDEVVQLRIYDNNLSIFESLTKKLDVNEDVKVIRKRTTFETPLYAYEYKGIEFTVLFDEEDDETLIAVETIYDYDVIRKLIKTILKE